MTWSQAALAEVATIVSGATPKTGVAEYWGGGIPWATPKDLSGLDSATIASTPRTISEAGLRSCAATVLPVGSVLFSSRAPIGHVAINAVPMATNQGFKSLVPKPGKIEPRYLYHWLRAHRQQLESLGNGATFKEVSKAVVSRVEIPLPPIEEQRRIAAILDRADALNDASNAVTASYASLMAATFRSMFGDIQRAMDVPSCGTFGDVVASLQGGRNLVGPDPSANSAFRVLKISAVTSGAFRPEESKPLPSGYVPDNSHLVRAGDLLMSRANTTAMVGATALVRETPENLAMPDKLWRLCWQDGAGVEPVYMAALLQQPAVRRALSARSSGTGGSMKNISKAKLMGMPLPVAAPIAQREFAQRVATIDLERSMAEVRRSKLNALRGSLQERAFSGSL